MKKVFLVLAVMSFNIGFAQGLRVDRENSNLVKFFCKATLNDFSGETGAVDGEMNWDGGKINDKSVIQISVKLDSLKTGIGLRDSHMRDGYLETEKFPVCSFKGKIIEADSLSPFTYKVRTTGDFYLHGYNKNISAEGVLTNFGKLFKLESTFTIYLSDFKIKQPSFLFNTVSNEVRVSLTIYFIKVE